MLTSLKKILYSLTLISTIFVIAEFGLRISQKPLQNEYIDSMDFYYLFIDIHNDFFKKLKHEDINTYIPIRAKNKARSFREFKNPNTKRIFIIGGSAADIIGNDSIEFEKQLQNTCGKFNYEVINCAIGGYNSYHVKLLVDELVNYNPDLFIILTGNNEGHGYTSSKNQYLFKHGGLYRIHKFFRKTHIYRTLSKVIKILPYPDIKSNSGADTEKIRQCRFENNLKDIANICKKNKIPTLLCTVPINYKDCPPGDHLPLFNKNIFLALIAMGSEKNQDALQYLKAAETKLPDNFLINFYIGRTLLGLKKISEAKYYLSKTADLDPARAGPKYNKIIKNISRNKQLLLADLDSLFSSISKFGLSGMAIFNDYCHFYSEYNPKIFSEIIYVLDIGNFFEGPIQGQKYKLLKEVNPIKFSNRSYENWLHWISESFDEENFETNIFFFKKLAKTNPDLLYRTLNSKQEIIDAYIQKGWYYELKNRLLNNWSTVLWKIGESYRRSKQYEKAALYFEKSIEINPNSLYALFFQGIYYLSIGNLEKSRKNFETISSIDNRYTWLLDLE